MNSNSHSNPSKPPCPFCGNAVTYSDTVCANCGGRLPWALALDQDRRARIAAEKEAERAQKEAETARRDAELAQANVQFAAPIKPRWAQPDDPNTFWAGCTAILFGVPLGCLGMTLIALGLILGWDTSTGLGVLMLLALYWISRAFR